MKSIEKEYVKCKKSGDLYEILDEYRFPGDTDPFYWNVLKDGKSQTIMNDSNVDKVKVNQFEV